MVHFFEGLFVGRVHISRYLLSEVVTFICILVYSPLEEKKLGVYLSFTIGGDIESFIHSKDGLF